jgi:hypothetical protein
VFVEFNKGVPSEEFKRRLCLQPARLNIALKTYNARLERKQKIAGYRQAVEHAINECASVEENKSRSLEMIQIGD